MNCSEIKQTLRRTAYFTDDQPGLRSIIVNPDGPQVARWIENAMEHLGYITSIALNHIPDEDVQEEIVRRAKAAYGGVK
jgi:hypothetical protein